ncbi:MAG: glycosyltransferase [Hylemonella sp.]|uniref:glycosyltransferase n=1 Tax=Hylemonella sp. TaxID=2066020 RepID=UPI00391B5EF1
MKLLARRTAVAVVYALQMLLVWLSYASCYVLVARTRPRKEWAVGVDEVAANVHNISRALGETVSVSLSRHPFYVYDYDHTLPARIGWRYLRYVVRIVYSPLLLGYLCHRVKGFFYVAGGGYLLTELDGRDREFRFLKARGLKIVCFFCGSEIRSLKLMNQLSRTLGRDLISTYQTIAIPGFDMEHLETFRMKLAASADEHADHVFNAPVDQISYLRKPVHPFMYFYPDGGFRRNEAKFADMLRVRIVHGPSSPLIKGTPLVRAAIKKLQLEGYDFEYQELMGVSNRVMLETLAQAHVVLNEFYALVPGQFGVEAMASHCALITSADSRIETTLPPGANSAWMVTEYWNIYENLKRILDDPALIRHYADAGFAWSLEHCGYQKNAVRLQALLGTAA